MRPMFAVTAGVALLLLASGSGWAGGKGRVRVAQNTDSAKVKETPPAFNKTFQWEEKELGPKDKGIDHAKIAAMQEQGRRDDEAKRKEQVAGGKPKKEARADGITGPATATLPTMDIEKPAPAGSVKSPVRKASYTPAPKTHDALDNLLAANGAGDSASSSEGLGSVLGKSKPARSAKHAKAAKHGKRRR
jgi:hypothetical protein